MEEQVGDALDQIPFDKDPIVAFEAWLDRFQNAPSPEAQEALLRTGEELAKSRRTVMQKLLRSDPARANQVAISAARRVSLPARISDHLEVLIHAVGAWEVTCALPPPGVFQAPDPIQRHFHTGGIRYRAYVSGSMKEQTTVSQLELRGVAIGSTLAVEDGSQRLAGAVADGPVTDGNATLLYIIAQFSDEGSPPITESSAGSHMNNVNLFWQENSYGVASITTTFITVQLDDTKANYQAQSWSVLLADARAKASAANEDYTAYDLDIVATSHLSGSNFGYAGRAFVNSRGCHLNGWFKLRTTSHELGHNYGLWHANYWLTDSDSPIGRDTNPGGRVGDGTNAEWREYGHRFSAMSAQNSSDFNNRQAHFSPYEKNRIGWLTDQQNISASGTYRVYRHDHELVTQSPKALKVNVNTNDYTGYARKYWLTYRMKYNGTNNNEWLKNGIQVDWCRDSYGSDGAIQLDMTPWSNNGTGSSWTSDNNDKWDGALPIGRTYSDGTIHITPTAKGGTAPNEWLDVVVNVGSFSSNQPPTLSVQASTTTPATNESVSFTATASDPDGDSLAYSWDFGDRNFGPNASSTSKSWGSAKEYVVRCTVSDMKGGTATVATIVTVGSPSTFRVSGTVLDDGGQPLENVHVYNDINNSGYRGTYTDSNGDYSIVDLAANTYTIKATKIGWQISPTSHSVTVGPNATDVDFTATRPTYSISGTVTSSGNPVSGVTVSDGTRSVQTNSNGNYTLTGVYDGSYTLTANKDGTAYIPSGWSNPVTVAGADVANRNFVEPLYTISGQILGLGGGASSTTVTDGHRTTIATKQGNKWRYTLSGVPQGTWTLTAIQSGYTFTPNNFANPVTVSNSNLSNYHFDAASGTSYLISGTITENGAGVEGVDVSNGSTAVTSDSEGKYTFSGITNGSYTVTPSKSGYTFTPTSKSVSVSNADQTGQDFTASSNRAPSIDSEPTASPNPVTLGN